MPRPGPRPYECVRRSWHSDRHQPMRGSIIQQIFRVVNGAHSSATKKNREWQEKIPIVVLKSEEIMYSKANSEAEYMNLETLWERVNDAINTIIRRDESTETGELLPPCIEAALNLGCIPVKASRSQRNNNPRSYLSPRAQEPDSAPPRTLAKTTNEQRRQLLQPNSGGQLKFATPTTANSVLLVSESNSQAAPKNNNNEPCNYPLLYENILPGRRAMETNSPLNLGSVYPLYYGTNYQTEESHLGSRIPENANSNTIFAGTPVSTSIADPAKMGVLQNLFSCSVTGNASNMITQADFMDTHGKLPGTECDLSLRLALPSDTSVNVEEHLARETEDLGPSSSQDGGKFSGLSPQKNKEFCFFPRKATNDSFEYHSRKWFPGGEDQTTDKNCRKRKVPFSNNEEDGQFCWQPEIPPNQFTGPNGPGL